PANNRCRGHLVVVKPYKGRRLSTQILFEFPVGASEHRVRDQRTMLVMRSKPFRPRDKQILRHKGSLDAVRIAAAVQKGVRSRAAGAHVTPAASFQSPALAEPIRTRQIQPTQVRSLQ